MWARVGVDRRTADTTGNWNTFICQEYSIYPGGWLQGRRALPLIGPGLAQLGRRDLRTCLVDEDAADSIGVLRLGRDLDVPVIVVANRRPIDRKSTRLNSSH